MRAIIIVGFIIVACTQCFGGGYFETGRNGGGVPAQGFAPRVFATYSSHNQTRSTTISDYMYVRFRATAAVTYSIDGGVYHPLDADTWEGFLVPTNLTTQRSATALTFSGMSSASTRPKVYFQGM